MIAQSQPSQAINTREGGLRGVILVVDDEPMARALLRLMLVRAGYEVAEAQDGQDALVKISQALPQVILLDVMMPEMDGYSVCRQLRAQAETATTPVIMLSARTDFESIRKGFEAGANLYLTKPISAENLTNRVREMLSQPPSPSCPTDQTKL